MNFSPYQTPRKLVQFILIITCFSLHLPYAGANGIHWSEKLLHAHSVEVNEVLYDQFGTKELVPFFDTTVKIVYPDSVWIREHTIAKYKGRWIPNSYYLCNGKKEYEYNGLSGTYAEDNAPQQGELSQSMVYNISAVSSLLYRGNPPVESQCIRSVTSEMLNNRMVWAITDTLQQKNSEKGMNSFSRVLVDQATGLPIRKSIYQPVNGKLKLIFRLVISHYVFNAVIPKSQFKWTPPAGAKPFAPPPLLPVGSVAPNFTAYTPNGTVVHLSDYKGKVVVLDFWATWCIPCQHSLPALEKLYQEVNGKNVVVLGVCVWDKKDAFDKWVHAKSKIFHFPVVFDPAGTGKKSIASGLYKVTGIPTQYVISKSGKVITGYMINSDSEAMLHAALASQGVLLTSSEHQAPK